MRVKSEIIRNEILEISKKEFLEKGFRDASLRDIAKKVNRTTGIIYTYFKSKDELFAEIVKPVTQWFNNRFNQTEHATEEEVRTGLKLITQSYETWLARGYRLFVEITDIYREEFKLLFFKSAGSKLEDFMEETITRASLRGVTILRQFERTDNFKGEELSLFFIQNLANYNVNIMKEMVGKNISKEKMLAMEHEYNHFIYYGMKALVKI